MSNRKPMTEDVINQHIRYVHGVRIDLRRIKNKKYFVSKLHQIVSNSTHPTDANSFQWRVSAVRYMEKVLKSEFSSSRDLRRKIERYLNGYDIRRGPVSQRIKRARKKKGWTQKQLAQHLGYKSHAAIAQFERGARYPTERIFKWLEEQGM